MEVDEGCRSFIWRCLVKDPMERMSLEEAMEDRWLVKKVDVKASDSSGFTGAVHTGEPLESLLGEGGLQPGGCRGSHSALKVDQHVLVETPTA